MAWLTRVGLSWFGNNRHPFDKDANKTDDEIAEDLIKVGSTSKARDGEKQLNLMDKLVFDDRISGLSDSCIDLMRKLMHPDPEKRMTSDDFRRHPWVQGLTASWKTMANTHSELAEFWQNRFRTEILKKFATSLGIEKSGQNLSDHDLMVMFGALDRKQNGVLELDEIETAFKELNIPDKHIRQIFASADLDGTGVIRWDEFQVLMRKSSRDDDDVAGGPGLQIKYLRNRFKSHIQCKFGHFGDAAPDTNKLREIFNSINLAGNGVLDPHEIRVVLRSAGEPEDVISRIVASLDIDHDGGVDWNEFQQIMATQNDD